LQTLLVSGATHNLLYNLSFSQHLQWLRCSKLSHKQPIVSSFPLHQFFCFGCPVLCFVQALQ
jgi:hypothetical protein